jgi:hypothetical protein
MQRGWCLGGVAEDEPDVYTHHHDKRTKHGDRCVEDVEERTRCRPPPSMADSYRPSINAATVASMRSLVVLEKPPKPRRPRQTA